MNEKDFRARYARAQEYIQASSELKEQTVVNARAGASRNTEESRQARKTPGHTVPKKRRVTRRSPSSRVTGPAATALSLKRWGLTATACLLAITLLIAGVPSIISFMQKDGPTSAAIALDDAAARCGFSIHAYASDGSEIINPGEGDIMVFDRDVSAKAGGFTGCLFRVEGDSVARVQMNVSNGELYRQDTEHITRTKNPERWKEATTWKPFKRGTGEYYGNYDVVYPLSDLSDGSIPLTSPDKPLFVNLLKRYGSTVDVSANSDPGITTGETCFGLLSYDDENTDFYTERNTAVDQFDGQRLTVTVTFENGRTATQVIELHSADFRAERNGSRSIVTSEIVDRDNLETGESFEHSVYGTVIALNDSTFPLSLDNANEYANTIMTAPTLDRKPETYRITTDNENDRTDVILDRTSLRGKDDTVDTVGFDGLNNITHLVVGCPTVVRSDRPLDGKTFSEFEFINGFRDDVAYANQCSLQVFGYGFNDNGTLTDNDHCYLTATFDVTNADNTEGTIYPIGDFALIDDDEGHCSMVSTSYDLDYTVSSNALSRDNEDEHGFTIAAGDTVQLTIVRVVPNYIADNPDLLFLFSNWEGATDGAFTIGDQV